MDPCSGDIEWRCGPPPGDASLLSRILVKVDVILWRHTYQHQFMHIAALCLVWNESIYWIWRWLPLGMLHLVVWWYWPTFRRSLQPLWPEWCMSVGIHDYFDCRINSSRTVWLLRSVRKTFCNLADLFKWLRAEACCGQPCRRWLGMLVAVFSCFSSLSRHISWWTTPLVRLILLPSFFFPPLTVVVWERHQRHVTGLYIHRHVRSKPVKLRNVSMATASSMWKLYVGGGVCRECPDSQLPLHPKHFTHTTPSLPPSSPLPI